MASLRAAVFCLVLAVSILDLGQSASITKVNSLDLPSGEKITKREAANEPPQTAVVHQNDEKKDDQEKVVKQTRPVPALHSSDDQDDSKSGEDDSQHIYKVKDHTEIARQRRAAPAKIEQAEDMDTAANTVFLPQFRRHFRPASRFRREVNDEAIENFISAHDEGNGRYVREAPNQANDLDTAANTVFLPQFRKKFRPFRQF